MIETGDVFITTTAFLESGWVLRSAYGFSTGEIAAALRGLTGLPGATVEKPQALARALDWCAGGMDFADALHLVKAEGCRSFLTFDHRLATVAKGLSSSRSRAPEADGRQSWPRTSRP